MRKAARAVKDGLITGCGYCVIVEQGEAPLDSIFTPGDSVDNVFNTDQADMYVAEVGADPTDEYYNKAVYYDYQPYQRVISDRTSWSNTNRIHTSRVIAFPFLNNTVDDMINLRLEGISIFENIIKVYNRMLSMDTEAVALANNLALKIFTLDSLPDKKAFNATSAVEDALARVNLGLNSLGFVALQPNEKFQIVSAVISGFRDLSEHLKDSLAFHSGLGRVVLFGEEPKGTSDSWWDRHVNLIAARQREYIVPGLTQLIAATFNVDPEEVNVEPNTLKEMSDKDAASIDFMKAQAESVRYGLVPKSSTPTPIENTGKEAELVNSLDLVDADLYVSMQVDSASKKLLSAIAAAMTLVPKDEMHCTLVNGTTRNNQVLDMLDGVEGLLVGNAYVDRIELWVRPDGNYLVARLEATTMVDNHYVVDGLIGKYYARFTGKDYTPHVTIAEVPDDRLEDVNNRLKNVDAAYNSIRFNAVNITVGNNTIRRAL